jgi:hypothetical protein
MRARLVIAGFGVTIGVGVSWLSTGAVSPMRGGRRCFQSWKHGRRTRLHRQTVH